MPTASRRAICSQSRWPARSNTVSRPQLPTCTSRSLDLAEQGRGITLRTSRSAQRANQSQIVVYDCTSGGQSSHRQPLCRTCRMPADHPPIINPFLAPHIGEDAAWPVPAAHRSAKASCCTSFRAPC
jgi:hypothetical protein